LTEQPECAPPTRGLSGDRFGRYPGRVSAAFLDGAHEKGRHWISAADWRREVHRHDVGYVTRVVEKFAIVAELLRLNRVAHGVAFVHFPAAGNVVVEGCISGQIDRGPFPS